MLPVCYYFFVLIIKITKIALQVSFLGLSFWWLWIDIASETVYRKNVSSSSMAFTRPHRKSVPGGFTLEVGPLVRDFKTSRIHEGIALPAKPQSSKRLGLKSGVHPGPAEFSASGPEFSALHVPFTTANEL